MLYIVWVCGVEYHWSRRRLEKLRSVRNMEGERVEVTGVFLSVSLSSGQARTRQREIMPI